MTKDDGFAIQWIEKSKLLKYAPGVDPKDPKSVPYEVVESVRELTQEETANVVKIIEGMKLGEIEALNTKINQKRADLKKLHQVK